MAGLCCALILAAGCAPKLEPVEVEFSRFEMEEMKRATVELKIFNPNGFEVDIENLGYVVLLARDTLAAGEKPDPVHIEAKDTTVASFPFTVKLELGDLLGDLDGLLSDTLRLQLNGRYSLRGFLGPKKRPFRYEQVFALRDLLDDIISPFERLFGGDE